MVVQQVSVSVTLWLSRYTPTVYYYYYYYYVSLIKIKHEKATVQDDSGVKKSIAERWIWKI